MTNKLVVIINSLKVPKIKKMLLYEMKFYVYWTVHHLYSCVKRKNQLDATYFII